MMETVRTTLLCEKWRQKMTHEQEEKLKRIREEMNIYDKAISVFDINRHGFLSKSDREKAQETIKKNRFAYFLECMRIKDSNHVRLNTKGFFGGQTVEVDQEFVDMCLEYFKKKRKELDAAYEALQQIEFCF